MAEDVGAILVVLNVIVQLRVAANFAVLRQSGAVGVENQMATEFVRVQQPDLRRKAVRGINHFVVDERKTENAHN
ncbi:MAG TPA: hypothetical protein VNX22_07535 [Acidobacteriaceae bacterium]|nr:hypothetical protein [Acidobacteriaceae bacterium]